MTHPRPLSDAPTTLMPELHETQPMHIAVLCGWCEIRLAAIPDTPRLWRGRFYHPCCLESALVDHLGGLAKAGPAAIMVEARIAAHALVAS